ncbi:glycosyltransferase family 4 protein [Terribacillus sp. AE2B 122]|uniref:glycosyltransferase family 4 protein n=1 Tax=Terribacillus sp. AE2B 122 TaxID=1331902 RepID=UPI001582C4EA|nr:glycosyltransferase family 4 protein [Terribacillus sp. AE2B 122]
MKVAIVHDWLVTYAGAERVLEKMLDVYPDADLYSTVDYLEDRAFIKNKKVHTTFIQNLPFSKKKYRSYLPLMPLAIEQFDFSEYDLIISSSHAVAKGIITGPQQKHICMCYSPIRYAWDLQHQYLKETGLDRGIKSIIVRYLLHRIRIWDIRTSNGVDEFIAISNFIQDRISKIYRRNSTVIYPPVYIEDFSIGETKEDYYITASRMVPYKKMDLIVQAFNEMPNKKLIVIGQGPDYEKIKKIAKDNIHLLGYQDNKTLKEYLQKAKAFIFAAEEDFGIAPLEAQASGTPVIAYGKGGALETINSNSEKPSGLFFKEQNVNSLIKAVKDFENNIEAYKPEYCRENAMRFSVERFTNEFKAFVEEKINYNEKENVI